MGDVEDTTQKEVEKKDGDSAAAGSDDDAGKENGTSSDDEGHEKDETGAVKFEGKEAQSFVEGLLDEFGLDSPDELKDFMANLSQLKGKIGDQDLDQILKNSETLETYQRHWAKQEREKQKEGETPEETIARLEKENEQMQREKNKTIDDQKQARAAERAIKSFNETVTSALASDNSLPIEYRPFLSEFLGVDNPINEVDIENKAAVRKLTKEGIKKLRAFEQVIIKRYRDGKTQIPKVGSAAEGGDTHTPEKGAEPKTLKDARRIVHESVQALLGKK